MTNYDLDMNNKLIKNCLDPAAAQDVATKNYVDTHSSPSSYPVLRITVPGDTPLSAPTVQDEALTVIISSGGPTFSVNILPIAMNAPDFPTFNGALPYETDAGETGYFVYGSNENAGNTIGYVWTYVPNLGTPPGVWTLIKQTNADASILGGCQLSPTTANGGIPQTNGVYVFCGSFTQVSNPDGSNVLLTPSGLVKYNLGTGVWSALPVPMNAPFLNASSVPQPPAEVWGIPYDLIATVGSFLIGFPVPVTQIGGSFGNLMIYDGSGTLKTLGPNAGDGIINNGNVSCAFDALNRLWVGGNFASITLNGTVATDYGIVCLTDGTGAFDIINTLNSGLIEKGAAGVIHVVNSYDASKMVICGFFDFQTGGSHSIQGVNLCYYGIGGLTDLVSGVFAGAELADDVIGALVIDQTTYVASFKNGSTYSLYGLDNGTSSVFATGLVSPSENMLNWYFDAINAVTPLPLSYINFAYAGNPNPPPTAFRDAFSGSYQTTSITRVVCQSASTIHHVKPSGAVGDAPSVTIQSNYASISLIGDLANNVWDCIGTTGTIVFNDP
jgi:hypothetical protein